MKSAARYFLLVLLILTLSSPISFADEGNTLESHITLWQDFYNEWMADDYSNNLICTWDYLATNSDGDTFYTLSVKDPDESVHEIGSCFLTTDARDRVEGLLLFCDVSEDLWSDATYMHIVNCLISCGLYSSKACDDAESFNRELDNYIYCLYGYHVDMDYESEYKLIGDFGTFGIHYVQSEDDSLDFITLEFYVN